MIYNLTGQKMEKSVKKHMLNIKVLNSSLVGQDATLYTANGWDIVSSATCTSDAVKKAATEVLKKRQKQ